MADLTIVALGPLTGDPKSTALDSVRRTLETAGVMARGDAFLNKDRLDIAADAESRETLEAASKEAGGLRLLTIRRGPKESMVKVVKGDDNWVLKPDITQSLASFRRVLGEKIAPADRFRIKGGPVLDESGFSIEEALEQGVLTIGAPASPTSQMVVLAKGVKPENLKSVEVDAGQNLAQLRAKLEADKFMSTADMFAGSDGAPLSPGQELGRPIKDAAGASKALAIVSGSQTVVVAKGVKPESLKSFEVDVSQNLAQLRAKLEKPEDAKSGAFMARTDTFAGSDGVAISRDQEPGRSIKDAAGANNLLAILSQGWI
jgi:hypothetical protein